MIFELSRDYKRAFELIKKGDRIVCLLDYGNGCRDPAANIASAYTRGEINVSARGISYIYLFDDQAETSEMFERECSRLNAEFYLPLPDNMLVISTEKAEEIATKVLSKRCDRDR